MIYLDNAATTFKKPQEVVNAVQFALLNYNANPGRAGHDLALKCSKMMYDTRVKVASFFNVKTPENVVFTPSCTVAVNIAMRGLIKKNDHFIISSLEHNCVSRTARHLESIGAYFDVAEYDFNEDVIVSNFEKLIKPNTKVIVCTHASNVFGVVFPIQKIGELCKHKNIKLIVDAAQSAGVLDIDIQKMNIDYLCVAAHKGLYSPMGIGILISDQQPEPLIFGGTGSNSKEQFQPYFTPDRFESGTMNVCGIAGVSGGIDFVSKQRNQIYQKELSFVNLIYNQLKKNPKIIFYLDLENVETVPVLSFNVNNESSEEVASRLNENNIAVRAGLHCSPFAHYHFDTLKTGTVRISPCVYNNINEAEKFIYTINKLYN